MDASLTQIYDQILNDFKIEYVLQKLHETKKETQNGSYC